MNQSLPWCKSAHVVHMLSRLARKGVSTECIAFLRQAMQGAMARLPRRPV